MSSVARAANQFTLDANPASFGAVVTDSAGNAYVTWEHSLGTGGIGPAQPMFCKLAPSAKSCKNPIALSLPGAGNDQNNADEVFPILGPGSTVWVVTARYVDSDVLIWTSTNGGASFGGAYDIPYIPTCPIPPYGCMLSYPYADNTDADDSLPITEGYATYGRQVYETASGHPSVYFLTSSANPGLGFTLNDTAETLGGPENASEFQFGNVGGGGVGGSALGTTSAGDVVEAYWLDNTPPTLRCYTYNPHAGPYPIAPQTQWSGPTTVGNGYLPRLADGAAGLFMLSSDSVAAAATPTLVDIREYDTGTNSFGAATRITRTPAGNALFRGGGLGENQATGELAAAWPTMTSDDLMQLYLSNDAARKFSPAQDVAAINGSDQDFDDVRVAISNTGTGWVTWEDDGGLQVANLYPLGQQYRKLRVHDRTLDVPVTCPAPVHRCHVTITVTKLHLGKIAHLKSTVPAGATRTLTLSLSSEATHLLSVDHGRIGATATIVVQPPGAAATTITEKASLQR